jgi:hypothetical protein
MSDKKEYGSAYLYAEDLIRDGNYIDATVTIESVIPPNTIKAANGKMIGHDTLKFVGKDKLLVLCAKVNQRILAIATGESQAEKWPGHKITLQVRIVDSFGEKVPAISKSRVQQIEARALYKLKALLLQIPEVQEWVKQ